MSRISRKELKTDELVVEVGKTVEYVQSHQDRLTLWGVVAVLVLAVGGGGYWYYTHRMDAANEALGLALHEFHAQIKPISLNDSEEPSYPTTKARDDAALKDFQAVADKYGMMRPGKLAHYYLGVTHLDQGQLAEAEKELNIAVNSGDSYVATLSRLAVGGVYARMNKAAEAEQSYRYLVDHPSDPVSKPMAQLALASFLGKTKPAEAEKIYKEMDGAKPPPELVELITRGRAEMVAK